MIGKDVILDCLGGYSRSNLMLMLNENDIHYVDEIWTRANRNKRVEIEDAKDFQRIFSCAKSSDVDGVLVRRVNVLTVNEQVELGRFFLDISPTEKGKFILTTTDFDLLDERLFQIFCKVKSVMPNRNGCQINGFGC